MPTDFRNTDEYEKFFTVPATHYLEKCREWAADPNMTPMDYWAKTSSLGYLIARRTAHWTLHNDPAYINYTGKCDCNTPDDADWTEF